MYCPLRKAEYRDGFYPMLRLPRTIGNTGRGRVGQSCADMAGNKCCEVRRDCRIPHLARSGARSEEYKPEFISTMKTLKQQISWEISVRESDFFTEGLPVIKRTK
jgi:hypothetical protein